eukprot:sb/3460793/
MTSAISSPWQRELEMIDGSHAGFSPSSTPFHTVELHNPITTISFYPRDDQPEFLVLTSVLADIQTTYFLFSISDRCLVSILTYPEPHIILQPSLVPIAISVEHVYIIAPGLTVDTILDRLMVYRSAEAASVLSNLNGRPTDRISHSSLSHALTYHQIESVKFCLNRVLAASNNLTEILEACEELVARSRDGSDFSKQVASLGANFIAQAVQIIHGGHHHHGCSGGPEQVSLAPYMTQLRSVLFAGETPTTPPSQDQDKDTCDNDIIVIPTTWSDMSPREVVYEGVMTGNVALAEYHLHLISTQNDDVTPGSYHDAGSLLVGPPRSSLEVYGGPSLEVNHRSMEVQSLHDPVSLRSVAGYNPGGSVVMGNLKRSPSGPLIRTQGGITRSPSTDLVTGSMKRSPSTVSRPGAMGSGNTGLARSQSVASHISGGGGTLSRTGSGALSGVITTSPESTPKPVVFEAEVHEILVELLQSRELSRARQVMSNMLWSGNTTLKEICVRTDDLELCSYLVSELPPNMFTREELEGERFLRQVQAYPRTGEPWLPTDSATTEAPLQLCWVIGWSKGTQELLLYEQQSLYGDGNHGNHRQFSEETKLHYHMWRKNDYVKTCDIDLLKDLFMTSAFFFLPLRNQYTIQHRLVMAHEVQCSLEEYIEANIHSNPACPGMILRHSEFEREVLGRAVEGEVYPFVVAHLLHDNHSLTAIQGPDVPEFQLIRSFVELSQTKTTESLHNTLELSLLHMIDDPNTASTSHPLLVALLLFYSPKTQEAAWYDGDLLRRSLEGHPKLLNTLFPETCLEMTSPTLEAVLTAFETWNEFGMSASERLNFTDPSLMESVGHSTSADFVFYLSMGRPFYALMSIERSGADTDTVLSKIQDLSLEYCLDKTFVAASVVVTCLLGRDCTDLVVGIQVMKLLSHNKHFVCPVLGEVVKGWILAGDVGNVVPLLTKALKTRGGLPRFESQLLLHLYCKRGSMDIVCQSDSWLDLIWNLHAWQVEKQRAVVIMENCTPAFRAHMRQVFYRMEEKTYGTLERSKFADCCGLFGKVAACIQATTPGKLVSLIKGMPVAAIIAFSLNQIPRMVAMVTWLQSTKGWEVEPATDLKDILHLLAGGNLGIFITALTIFHSSFPLLPLFQLVDDIKHCRVPSTTLPSDCLKCFTNWDDDLLPDVETVKSFVIIMLSELITTSRTNFEQFFAVDYLKKYPLHRVVNLPDYGRLSLLREVLKEARLTLHLFHDSPEEVRFSNSDIHRTIAMSCREEDVKELLEKMICNEQYDLARKISQIAGFNTAEAIYSQLKNQLARFKKSDLSQDLESRIQFWKLIESRFELFQYELADRGPIIRAKLFLAEGCNLKLGDMERALLISTGLTAIITSKPSVGKVEGDRLRRFYWVTVATAFLKEQVEEAQFYPIENVQPWELIDIGQDVTGFRFPDYPIIIDEPIKEKLTEFVNEFLLAGSLERAEKVASLFDIKSDDLLLVRACQDIAEEYLSVKSLSKPVRALVKDQFSVCSNTTIILASGAKPGSPIKEWSFRRGSNKGNEAGSGNSTFYDEQLLAASISGTQYSREQSWAAFDELYIGDLLGTYVRVRNGLSTQPKGQEAA